jgi:signal transduction histidine kinase
MRAATCIPSTRLPAYRGARERLPWTAIRPAIRHSGCRGPNRLFLGRPWPSRGAGSIWPGAVRVTRDLDPALTVEADRERLGQVFSILMDNALRYAAEGRELAIRVTLEGEQRLFIEFADRGPGFVPEALPLTLDRFWRAESARSQHKAGSGLGLSIASAISTAHGGSLWNAEQDLNWFDIFRSPSRNSGRSPRSDG